MQQKREHNVSCFALCGTKKTSWIVCVNAVERAESQNNEAKDYGVGNARD
jgi:hypothetical protein